MKGQRLVIHMRDGQVHRFTDYRQLDTTDGWLKVITQDGHLWMLPPKAVREVYTEAVDD